MSIFKKSEPTANSYAPLVMKCSPCSCKDAVYCDGGQLFWGQAGVENATDQANTRFGGSVEPNNM